MRTEVLTSRDQARPARHKLKWKKHTARTGTDSSQTTLHEIPAAIQLQTSNPVGKIWLSINLRLALLTWSAKMVLDAHVKRIFDLLVCLVSIPLAMPLMLLTAIAIRLDSPGQILFKQQRVGMYGQPFACYKFRSMYVDAEARKAELLALNEADEVIFKMKNDPRVTRVGRVIRKLSIDELPQIFNVLKGEMSFVGPRPPVPYEVEQYEIDQFRRLEAVPGITGLQQVSGRSTLSFRRWVELDVEYIETQSLGKDIQILAKTIPTVISRKGAY
jgi:exopolysaccharide biosynthesis polyprenyl glycosylphosphotransferase